MCQDHDGTAIHRHLRDLWDQRDRIRFTQKNIIHLNVRRRGRRRRLQKLNLKLVKKKKKASANILFTNFATLFGLPRAPPAARLKVKLLLAKCIKLCTYEPHHRTSEYQSNPWPVYRCVLRWRCWFFYSTIFTYTVRRGNISNYCEQVLRPGCPRYVLRQIVSAAATATAFRAENVKKTYLWISNTVISDG